VPRTCESAPAATGRLYRAYVAQRSAPAVPEQRQPDPEEAIEGDQHRSLPFSLEGGELQAESGVLHRNGSMSAHEETNESKDTQKDDWHASRIICLHPVPSQPVAGGRHNGDKTGFRRHMSVETLRYLLPTMLSNAAKNERNLILRPISARAVFIQLDDLSREGLDRVKPVAFLGLETSPGNYQAWVAIPAGQSDKDFARRLRKGAGADDTASGATRVAGSLNFKDKYAPDFPTVQAATARPV